MSGGRRPSVDGGRRLSVGLATADADLKPAWAAFLDAAEVCHPPTVRTLYPAQARPSGAAIPAGPAQVDPVPSRRCSTPSPPTTRCASPVAWPDDAFGRPAFDKVLQATLVSQVPHRTKSLMTKLDENWKLRPAAHGTIRVLVSGAGPTGLRAAVEAALMGMRVLALTLELALTLALTLT